MKVHIAKKPFVVSNRNHYFVRWHPFGVLSFELSTPVLNVVPAQPGEDRSPAAEFNLGCVSRILVNRTSSTDLSPSPLLPPRTVRWLVIFRSVCTMARERKIDVAEAVTVSLTDNTTATSVSESSSTLASRAAGKMTYETENRRPSRLPIPLQFLLVVILSFSLSSLAYSFLDQVTRGELATIAKQREDWSEIALAAGWRM